MDIVSPDTDHYLDRIQPPRSAVFEEMEERARQTGFPIVGPKVGALLELLARALGARRIMDLGSGFGYSALWAARGLTPPGKVILTDFSEENLEEARGWFEKANLADRAEMRPGNAVVHFADDPGPFDLVINDVDKELYPEVLRLAHARLRKGGLLLTDNTLWSGQVLEQEPDETTRRIQEFDRRLAEHPGFHSVQIPLRDGVALAVKK